jgi:pimeloyl-ACP methyl ester carboxylesterase
MTVETMHVHANGLRFACIIEGTGPLVLLLHGFPDTARSWDLVRPKIAERGYRAVCPYMRGYDPTGLPPRDADLRTIGEDALALVHALGEESAILVGHDWGATAVYAAAALEPRRVKKLFAVAIPHPWTMKPTPSVLWGVRHFLAFKLPGAAARFAADDFAALPDIYRRWSPTWTPEAREFDDVRRCFSNRASLHAALGYYRALSPFMPEFAKRHIDVPAVVFAGLDDPVARPPDYRRAARMFTKEYVVEEIPGGHFLHRESPERFAERLLAHL